MAAGSVFSNAAPLTSTISKGPPTGPYKLCFTSLIQRICQTTTRGEFLEGCVVAALRILKFRGPSHHVRGLIILKGDRSHADPR